MVIIQESNVSLKCFFGSWEFDFFKEFGDLLLLCGYSLGCYCSSKEIYFLYPKMALSHAEFKDSFPQALETARRFLINCSGVLAAMPKSST